MRMASYLESFISHPKPHSFEAKSVVLDKSDHYKNKGLRTNQTEQMNDDFVWTAKE